MKTLREEAIIQLVRSRLCQDQRVCGQMIDVSAVDGEVMLAGQCDSDEQKRIAEIIAKGTHGVRLVIDNVRVRRVAQSI